MTTNRLSVAVVSMMAISALAAVVLIAIGTGSLGDIIGGMLVGGIILLAFLGIVVVYYYWINKSRERREKLLFTHAEEMAKHGIMIDDSRALTYRKMVSDVPQIAAPPAKQQAVSQIIFNPNALRESAVNLLLFSMRQCGADQNRIASGPECAAAGVNGYTPRTWSKIVNDYLAPRYGVVTARGSIDNGGGTYVPDTYRTVEALYHKVKMDAEVDDLPGITR